MRPRPQPRKERHPPRPAGPEVAAAGSPDPEVSRPIRGLRSCSAPPPTNRRFRWAPGRGRRWGGAGRAAGFAGSALRGAGLGGGRGLQESGRWRRPSPRPATSLRGQGRVVTSADAAFVGERHPRCQGFDSTLQGVPAPASRAARSAGALLPAAAEEAARLASSVRARADLDHETGGSVFWRGLTQGNEGILLGPDGVLGA